MRFDVGLLAVALLAAQSAAGQTPEQPASAQQLTIEAIFAEGGVTGRGPESIQWSPDGTAVSFVQRDDSGEHGSLWHVDIAGGKKAILVAEEKLATLAPPTSRIQDERKKEWITRYSVASYHWAPDSKHLLFDSQGQLWLYDLATGTAVQVTSAPEPSSDPKFSPDGRNIAYLRKHNLYVGPASGEGGARQLTSAPSDRNATAAEKTERAETLLHGEVDWVYAEELDVRSNYFWSPDGRKIAFLEMDEKAVPTYPITDLLPARATLDLQKYPRPGDPNPAVRLGVVNASSGKVRWISLGEPAPEYIPRFGWVNSGLLWVETLNRAQNKLDLYFADASSGRFRKMLEEASPNWVEVNDMFRILDSGNRFLWPSWRDGHTHLYLYQFDKNDPLAADAKLERQLTRGDFELFSVDKVDDAAGLVYFTGNAGDARQRQLYRVKLDGSGLQRVSREEGTHQASFGKNPRYYVDKFSALLTPPSLSLCTVGGSCQNLWSSRSLAAYSLIPPRFLDFQAEDGTVLRGVLQLPANAQTAAPATIPLMLDPYCGPGAQTVVDAWGGTAMLFNQLLARRGFAILTVDNRGTAGRGQKFTVALRHHFGEVELRDQLSALDQALAQLPALDPNRLGWWGWSYGGYMTLYALSHSDRFRAGFSVAPVTDWRDYDSIYTERYMGLPKDNADGYNQSSPVNSAASLHGSLVIAHGTSDDNVHFQNTVQMTRALITAQKRFNLMLYPGKTHGISGSTDRSDLFHRILDHFETELMRPAAPLTSAR